MILGVSADSMRTHELFAAKLDLPFPLLSDTERRVIELYGALKEKSMYGRKVLGINRSTFVIDREGIIRRIWRNVSVSGHAEEVLGVVQQLATES